VRFHYELSVGDLQQLAETRDFYTQQGELLVLTKDFKAAMEDVRKRRAAGEDAFIMSVPAGTRTKAAKVEPGAKPAEGEAA
jgi:hypothetical protein